MGALKALASQALAVTGAVGRPADELRHYYDLPATSFAFNSFEIAFGYPNKNQQVDFVEENTLDKVGDLLRKGLIWAQDPRLELVERTPEWRAIVEALSKLAPPQSGAVTKVEVSGDLPGAFGKIELTRQAALHVAEAKRYLSSPSETVVLSGSVREFDKDKFSFTLRNLTGATLALVQFDDEKYDSVWDAFITETPVTAVLSFAAGVYDLISLSSSLQIHLQTNNP
jgi:hypothetical protein